MKIKDMMLTILKDYNKDKDLDEVVTRLHYKDTYVEDFSMFTNESYMSNELLNALKNGMTLTSKLKNELNEFINSKYLVLE